MRQTEYKGIALTKTVTVPKIAVSFKSKDGKFVPVREKTDQSETIHPYIPHIDLIKVVKMAQLIHRPILLRGEPGCGKTQLAKAVAYELYGDDYREHYFEWFVKSHSKAQDGLFTFDHIRRLRDANRKNELEETEEILKSYRDLGPLGKAFAASSKDNPAILLIDEIDKADIDFPNDLLLELDEKRFVIAETGEEIRAEYPPLIFITSNQEKELPSAFLRRCLFMYIKFPDPETLNMIISARFHDWAGEDSFKEFASRAVSKFQLLRDEINKDVTTSKQISTGELLDWINYLVLDGRMSDDLKENAPRSGEFPGFPVLLKNISDLTREKIELR